MILITGANGHLGGAVIDFLLKKGVKKEDIRGMVREKSKAGGLTEMGVGVRMGDYNDYHTLLEAFGGVEKLLLVSGTDLEARSRQHENAVMAAAETGVKHIVYTSFERNNETESSPIYQVSRSHLFTERLIRGSGLTFTIMRNNLYMDGLPMFLGKDVLETGVFIPAGETQAAFATRIDMAEAAANILTGQGHENREYYVSNTEAVSFAEIAKILSDIAGKEVPYNNPDTDTYKVALTEAGVPPEAIAFSVSFAEGVKQGEFLPEKSDLENLLGRKPVSIKEFLRRIYGGN